MKHQNSRIISMSEEASEQMHEAMFKSLAAINDYFQQPHSARKNLAQDMRVANSVINSFAKIRQHESGRDMVILQVGKMVCESKEELGAYIDKNLPHLSRTKKLLPE